MEDFPNTNVIELGTNNLNLNEHNNTVHVDHPSIRQQKGILCGYAPWCGHCIRLKPILHQLSQIVDQHGIKISIFNADADPNSTLSRIGLRHYPTLFWIKDNQELELFEPESRELPILLNEIKSKFGNFNQKKKKTSPKKKTTTKKRKLSPKKRTTPPKKKKTSPKKKITSPKKKTTKKKTASPKKKTTSPKKKTTKKKTTKK